MTSLDVVSLRLEKFRLRKSKIKKIPEGILNYSKVFHYIDYTITREFAQSTVPIVRKKFFGDSIAAQEFCKFCFYAVVDLIFCVCERYCIKFFLKYGQHINFPLYYLYYSIKEEKSQINFRLLKSKIE